jgi:hypothetical protein
MVETMSLEDMSLMKDKAVLHSKTTNKYRYVRQPLSKLEYTQVEMKMLRLKRHNAVCRLSNIDYYDRQAFILKTPLRKYIRNIKVHDNIEEPCLMKSFRPYLYLEYFEFKIFEEYNEDHCLFVEKVLKNVKKISHVVIYIRLETKHDLLLTILKQLQTITMQTLKLEIIASNSDEDKQRKAAELVYRIFSTRVTREFQLSVDVGIGHSRWAEESILMQRVISLMAMASSTTRAKVISLDIWKIYDGIDQISKLLKQFSTFHLLGLNLQLPRESYLSCFSELNISSLKTLSIGYRASSMVNQCCEKNFTQYLRSLPKDLHSIKISLLRCNRWLSKEIIESSWRNLRSVTMNNSFNFRHVLHILENLDDLQELSINLFDASRNRNIIPEFKEMMHKPRLKELLKLHLLNIQPNLFHEIVNMLWSSKCTFKCKDLYISIFGLDHDSDDDSNNDSNNDSNEDDDGDNDTDDDKSVTIVDGNDGNACGYDNSKNSITHVIKMKLRSLIKSTNVCKRDEGILKKFGVILCNTFINTENLQLGLGRVFDLNQVKQMCKKMKSANRLCSIAIYSIAGTLDSDIPRNNVTMFNKYTDKWFNFLAEISRIFLCNKKSKVTRIEIMVSPWIASEYTIQDELDGVLYYESPIVQIVNRNIVLLRLPYSRYK